MEVRIKDNNGYVDANWTIEGGIMVGSPKFEPKDGDVLSSYFKGKCNGIFILEEVSEYREAIFHVALKADGRFFKGDGCSHFGYIDDDRPATEEEKQKLFDKLKEEGYEWDAEKKEVVKIKWKPVLGEVYFRIEFVDHEFRYADWIWKNSTYEIESYERGWCFKTKEECQEFCNRLNDAINQVKP